MIRNFKHLFLGIVFFSATHYVQATTHTILVGQSGLTFSPSSITTVVVGDVIHWSWVSGSHTSTSLVIPGGAASWTNGMTSAAANFDYTVTTAGTYNYQCNPHSGSGMTGSFVASAATSVDQSSMIYSSLVVSPNPATDRIQLEFNSDHSFRAELLVFDASGNEQMKKYMDAHAGDNEFSLSISSLPKGMYFLNVLDDGTALVVRKFIKE